MRAALRILALPTFVLLGCLLLAAVGRAQNASSRGANNLATNQVSVAATATQVAAARSTRNQVCVTNPSATAVYCGNSNVTTSTGFEILGTTTVPLTRCVPFIGALYCIVASSTQTVSVDDEYN